jgi:flagellar biosynthesis GTPase FlhF
MDTKTLDIDRLRKVVALYGSPNQGEKLAALDRTESLLKAHGKTFLDLLDIKGRIGDPLEVADLKQQVVSLQIKLASTWGNIQHANAMREHAEKMREHADRMREHAEKNAGKVHPAERDLAARQKAQDDREHAWRDQRAREQKQHAKEQAAKEKQAAEQAERERKKVTARKRKDAAERKAIIARYNGSTSDALAPCKQEMQLRKAVSKFPSVRDNRGGFVSIDGCSWMGLLDALPDSLLLAIEGAYPMPETITEAFAEYAYWQRRSREINLVLKRPHDDHIDAVTGFRFEMIGSMLYGQIDATSLDEVLIHLRMFDHDNDFDALYRLMKHDLKALCAAAKSETVVSHEAFRAARQKREAPVKQPKQRLAAAQTAFEF